MKKRIISLILIGLITAPVFADSKSENSYKNISISKKRKKTDLNPGGIRIGYSGLVESLSELSLPEDADYLSQDGKSINFDLSFFNYTYYHDNYFGLSTGLDLEVNNFRFSENISLRVDENGNTVPDYSYTDAGVKLQKSKLVTTYLNVPLLLKFYPGGTGGRGFSDDKGFCFYGGLVGGWRIAAHTKTKSSQFGKVKDHDDFNIRNFHWGYMAGFSYKNYGVYAKYYPQSIFKPGKGPSVEQVNIGFSLGF